MNRNNMSKKQRRESEAKGYHQTHNPTSDGHSYHRNDENPVVRGTYRLDSERPTVAYTMDEGRSIRNYIQISKVKSHA